MELMCSKCDTMKPCEAFYKRPNRKRGYYSACIDCTILGSEESRKKWREENKDKQKIASDNWYQNNKERKLESGREWRKNNPDKVKQITKRSNSNRTKEQVRQANLDRRARLKSVPNTMPKNWWQVLLTIYGPWCAVPGCDKEINEDNPLTHDHVIPLSQPGSSHSIANSQILCYSHNASKGNRSCIDYRVVK
jgi:hypothetical protein